MKDSDFLRPVIAPTVKLSNLALCIRLALGVTIASCALTSTAFAEGTKQWSPNSTDGSALGVGETGSSVSATYPFAGYDQPADNRLYIHIADPSNEKLHIGLSDLVRGTGTDANVPYYFRIKAPDGTVVFGPYLVGTGGTAPNLTSYAAAAAGPSNITAGGYSTSGIWTFDPATAGKGAGDYYIEFDLNNSTASVGSFSYTESGYNYTDSVINIKWFDLTVATKAATPTAINGRIWSKNWAVRANDPATYQASPFAKAFNGSMYAYDAKNYVTKIDFQNSGLRPLQGQFSFNDTGTASTGVKATDRKSVMNANQTTPSHKIFLNPPDTNVYPLGVEGVPQNLPLKVDSTANTAVQVDVTQPGAVDIVLDINNDGTYTAGLDRRLYANVNAGVNQVPWDGKNGAGATVPKSQYPITALLTYTQGETHFTAYDVEGLDNGFKVYTQTAGGTVGPNLQFWDDSNITQPSGVTPTVLTNTDTGAITRQTWNYLTADQLGGYGNGNTINTWWYAFRNYQSTLIVMNNAPPTATNDSANTAEDTVLNGSTVLANDSDTDGDTLTVSTTPVTAPTHGTLVLKADGTYTYTPSANFNGTDSFTYSVSDGNGGTATATVTVTVTPVNDAPVANDDAASTPENTPLNGTTLLANDADLDGDTLTVNTTPVTAPTHGTLVLNANGTYTYTPNTSFNGTDSFTYAVSDGKGGSDTATVTVTITPVNDAPVANNDSATV
ncbi:cadherin-like domain-containing protein, partial [Candidatus Thiothrix sp. Deng01]